MITELNIKDIATYKNEIKLSDLGKINIFYGSNGVGKTTISNVISQREKFSEAGVILKGSDKVDVLVYNKNFIKANFDENAKEYPGIFTLGEDNIETLKKLEELEILKETIEKDNHIKQEKLKETKKTDEEKKEKFKEEIWEILKKYKFNSLFKFNECGNKKSAVNTFLKKINECKNPTNLPSLEDLKKRCDFLYSKETKTELETLKIIFTKDNIISEQIITIFNTPLIGNNDLDISKLIDKFQNSDWVNKGREYIKEENTCPFCQQETITEEFKVNLGKYFNKEYNQQLQNIKESSIEYQKYSTNTSKNIETISTFLEKDKIIKIENATLLKYDKIFNDVKNKIAQNLQGMEKKEAEPSRKILLIKIDDSISELNTIIAEIDSSISEYNKIIQNLDKEKKIFEEHTWEFISKEKRNFVEEYNKDISKIEKEITEIKKEIAEIEKNIWKQHQQ